MTSARPLAILFDVDGTLIDDDGAVEAAVTSLHSIYNQALDLSAREFARRWKELLDVHFARYLSGEISMQEQRRARIRDLFASSSRSMAESTADEIFDIYERSYRAAWSAFPDAAPALSALQGYRLAVLTNGENSQQKQKLQATGLATNFSDVFVSSEVGFVKPQPEVFLYACKQLGIGPECCAYVGDNLDVDARGSAAAGLKSIWLDRWGSVETRDDGIRVIHGLAELPDMEWLV